MNKPKHVICPQCGCFGPLSGLFVGLDLNEGEGDQADGVLHCGCKRFEWQASLADIMFHQDLSFVATGKSPSYYQYTTKERKWLVDQIFGTPKRNTS